MPDQNESCVDGERVRPGPNENKSYVIWVMGLCWTENKSWKMLGRGELVRLNLKAI